MHVINTHSIHSFCTSLINGDYSQKFLLFIHDSKMCCLSIISLCFSPLKHPYGHHLSIYYLSIYFNWKTLIPGFGTGMFKLFQAQILSSPHCNKMHVLHTPPITQGSWHPEMVFSSFSLKMFKATLDRVWNNLV